MSWSFQDQMVGNAPKLAKSYQISFCYELRNVREKLKPHNSRTFNDISLLTCQLPCFPKNK